MTLRYCSRCSGTRDTRWKSQHATSRACQSPPSISSSCHRSPISQVKACFQEMFLLFFFELLFTLSCLIFIKKVCAFFFKLAVILCCHEKKVQLCDNNRMSDEPVKVTTASRRSTTQSPCLSCVEKLAPVLLQPWISSPHNHPKSV